MKTSKRFGVFTIPIMMLFVFFLGGCFEQTTDNPSLTKVRVAVSQTPLSSPFFIAEQQDFFKGHGIDVEIVPCRGGVNCAKLLQKGDVDYATASETVALFHTHKYGNVKILSNFVRSARDLRLLALLQSGIKSINDLSGKRVGIVQSSSSEFYFDLVLIASAMHNIVLERVYLQPDRMVEALHNGEVDAISVWEPYGYQVYKSSKHPAVELGFEGIYELYFNVLRLTDSDLTQQQHLALLKGLRDGIDWITENPSASQKIVSSVLNLTEEQLKWNWGNYNFQLSNDYSLTANLQMQARWASSRNILEGPPVDVRPLVEDDFFSKLQD